MVVRTFSVMVAPNGARRNKSDHAALPLTIDEIAMTAKSCGDAGASAIHLHVRDADGNHSLDAGRYLDAMAAISQNAPDMGIQITTEAAGVFDVPTQFSSLQKVCPNAASVSVREMSRDMVTAQKLYAFAAEAQIDLQHILYTPQDVATLRTWMGQGIVPDHRPSVIFVLGQYAPPILAKPDDLLPFLRASAGMNLDWSICAFGPNELACVRTALTQGGNVRVGFENNTQMPDGSSARDNAALVALAIQEGLKLGLSHPTSRKVA